MVKSDQNQWTSYPQIDGRNPDGTSTAPVGKLLTFDDSGKLKSITDMDGTNPNTTLTVDWTPGVVVDGVWESNGAAGKDIAVNMSNITQYNSASCRNPPV
ncbi:flagellar basal body FlgE domain-containing protein, partial [Pseudomonas viridiflava]|uniref:flagellar basal body FlgE domain-containing protein n=1 Tax=Pseudomonas viridiflava TaxID=33069 RepID=UPI0024029C1C